MKTRETNDMQRFLTIFFVHFLRYLCMFQVLCLSPTRELAVQIQKVVLALGDYMNVQCHSCIGKKAFLLLSHFVEAIMLLNIQPLGDRPATTKAPLILLLQLQFLN